MIKNILILSDGTELSSGQGVKCAIKSVKSTCMVNGGEELTIGSACSNMIEVSLFSPNGDAGITAGDQLTHYKQDEKGTRTKVGIFTVEGPERPTANTMKLTGYDNVSKLDKDLTAWLETLTGWPYTVNGFASMVCSACGVEYVEQSNLPNGDFPVNKWKKAGATGRQIMRWLGEIVCRYVYADPDGKIRFGWYQKTDKRYTPAGESYFFAGSLKYEDFQTAPIEAVQIGLADGDSGAPWPLVADGANSYVIRGNPILNANVSEELLPYLQNILHELSHATYTPCEVSVPATMCVNSGDIFDVTDKNGKTVTVYVMSKVTSGQRDTIRCTGSQRRDSTTAMNNKPVEEKMQTAASAAVSAQTQMDIFNKLTNNGQSQGIYIKDGLLYINATYIKSGMIVSEGVGYLPPTYDDAISMLFSLSFPEQYPPMDFYDLNGDGVFDREDVLLANRVYLGEVPISSCAGARPSNVTVTINPFDAEETIKLVGTNMWGSQVSTYFGVNGSGIPHINGDCSVSGRLAVGGSAIVKHLATEVDETPKAIFWKDNGDGTYTLIGQ